MKTANNRQENKEGSNGSGRNQQMMPEAPIEKNIDAIMKLERQAVKSRSKAERIADKVTTFAGNTPFIIFHMLWFGGWIIVNLGLIPHVIPFDRFPFSFLTLVVSLEAIFLTLLVLMSQNRMTKEADKRAHLDLQINMLAEQESTLTLKTVQIIAKHLGLENELEKTAEEFCEETDVDKVAKALDEKSATPIVEDKAGEESNSNEKI